jgi:hypothetical protein
MLYELLVLAAVIGCGWVGVRIGLASIAAATLELLGCAIGAAIVHEPLVALLDAGVKFVLGDVSLEAWLYPLVYAAITAGGFMGLRRLLHRDSLLPGDPRDDSLFEKAAAAVAGGIGGFVAAGAMLITISMLPMLSSIKPTPRRMFLDAGRPVLRAAAAFAGDVHDGRSLPVFGEPPSRAADPNARLTSEPWFDADGDGEMGESDRFSDVDANGIYTKDLYYSDLDGDGIRRVGLLDKYVAGCWQYEVLQFDRERTDLAKPVAAAEEPRPAEEQPSAKEDVPVDAPSPAAEAPPSAAEAAADPVGAEPPRSAD